MQVITELLSRNGRKIRITRCALLALGALLTGLTLLFPEIGILEWVSLVPAAVALIGICEDESVRARGLYGYGYFFFFCFYLVNYHWFVSLYPLDFIGEFGAAEALAVVLAGWLGLSALQAVAGGAIFVLFAQIVRSGRRISSVPFGALWAGALWAVLEWTQTLTWAGVPWCRLAIGQTGWLIGAQSASLFGSCFVSFLIVTVNFLLAYAILKAPKRRFAAIFAAAIFILNTAIGATVYLSYSDKGEPIRVSVVQGNISSSEKWSSEMTYKMLEVYEEYTKKAATEGAEIVIWPETAIPYNIDDNLTLKNYLRRVANESDVTVLCGAFTNGSDGIELNSIITALDDGSIHGTVYSKRHLVPFGEFVPLRGLFEVLIPPLAEIGMLSEDLGEGEGANVLRLEEADIGSLICFDSIYDELVRDSVLSGAQILAISTNDSWFWDSAALDMHNAQAKLRAIENRRYVVRSANTGISGIIDPRGRTEARLSPLIRGEITVDVYANEGHTLFTYIGNSFVYMCIVFLLSELICIKLYIKYFAKSLDKKGRK